MKLFKIQNKMESRRKLLVFVRVCTVYNFKYINRHYFPETGKSPSLASRVDIRFTNLWPLAKIKRLVWFYRVPMCT